MPITEERISKAILSCYDSKRTAKSTNVLTLIRRTIMQKCRRIFDRCSRLLFPKEKEKRKNEGRQMVSEIKNKGNKKIENKGNKPNSQEEKVKVMSKDKQTKKIEEKGISQNLEEMENLDDEEADENENNKLTSSYPFQQLMNELSGNKYKNYLL